MNLHINDIIISDTIIQSIIENYTTPEKGVRNLKRNIETIVSKINLFRLLKPNTNIFDHESINISFPLTINYDLLDKLLTKLEQPLSTYLNMYL